MNELDLTEAVDAAARGLLASEQRGYKMPLEWESLAAISQHNMRESVLPIVIAAAPLIERQVREQIAREIEGQRDGFLASPRLDETWIAGWHSAVAHLAARIARGAS